MNKLNEVYLRISPGKFHFLKFILEGYDNLALLSSFQGSDGVVVIRYPQEMAEDLFSLLGSVACHISKPNGVSNGVFPQG